MPYTRTSFKPLACAVLASVAALFPAPASAGSPFLVTPEASVAEATPAYRYANMTNEEALEELDRRKILYLKVDHAPGVRAPVRLTGRLNGVNFHSALPPEQRVASMFEILDARLALALDDFAAVLARHDIDEVIHYTMYRPNVAKPGRDGDREETAPARPATAPAARDKSAPDEGASDKGASDGEAPASTRDDAAHRKAPESATPAAIGKKGAREALRDSEPRSDAAGRKQKDAPRAAAVPSKPAQTITDRGAVATKPAGRATPAGKAALTDKAAPAGKAAQAGKTSSLDEAAPPSVKAAPASTQPRDPGRPTTASRPKAGATAGQRRANVALRRSVGQKPRALWAPPGTRHPAGLAIDVGALKKHDGTWISVARQFHGHLGDKTCGEGARLPELPEARELRSIVCESAEIGIFTYVLTPNYNVAHADHYHMEIKPGVRWFLYN